MNNSRDKIFKNLVKFKNNTPLEIKTFQSNYENIEEEFIKKAKIAGATIYSTKEEIENFYKQQLKSSFTYHALLGVAENGALWCYDFLGLKRSNLFTCTELIITIRKSNLVSNMDEAYKKIDLSKKRFGTFIAGPSKTADIEQSLVIGAHGAMSLHIILT